jgi:DNA ligase D-like protein (predicted ligase)
MNPADTGSLPLVKPMLAVPALPFDHPDYFFEIKWDGYRCLAYLDGQTTLVSRNLKNITAAFPDLGGIHLRVNGQPLLLDGEIIALQDGKPSFDALQSRAKLVEGNRVRRAAQALPVIYVAFDILYHRGKSLMQLALHERREYLRVAILTGENLIISEPVQGEGVAYYRACVDKGLEGVVAKRMDSKYLPGTRSLYWKKLRHTREADLVICGYREGRGSRLLGALVLAAWNGTSFVYQGMVGSGLSREEELYLLKQLADLGTVSPPFIEQQPPMHDVHWVQPRLVCRVEYLTLTREGILRHPVYKGLRSDKLPEESGLVEEQN